VTALLIILAVIALVITWLHFNHKVKYGNTQDSYTVRNVRRYDTVKDLP